jgi:hypothetical protein
MTAALIVIALAAEPVSVSLQCDGFTAVECRAWAERFTRELTVDQKVVEQAGAPTHVEGVIAKAEGHACDVSVKLLKPSGETWLHFARSVDFKERVDRALDEAAGDFRSVLTIVPRSPAKVAVLLGTAEVGLGLSVIGAVLYGISQVEAGHLRSDFPQTPGEVAATAAQGSTYQPAGATLLGIGLAVIAASIVWLIIGATP